MCCGIFLKVTIYWNDVSSHINLVAWHQGVFRLILNFVFYSERTFDYWRKITKQGLMF